MLTLNSQALPDIICALECNFHKYADDNEFSKSGSPDEFVLTQSGIQTCNNDVSSMFNSNRIMLNTDKTGVMAAGVLSCLRLVDRDSANIRGPPSKVL